MNIEPSTCKILSVTHLALFLNNDGPKGVKGATEEDKKEPDGPCEMGLTDTYPWADKGQA